MASTPRRTVLTGFGVLSPIGSTPEAFWDALVAGVCGVRTISLLDASELPCHIAGEVPNFSAKAMIDKSYRRSLNAMARTVELGVIGSQLGLANAGIAKGTVPAHRIGIEFASLMGATELNDMAAASRIASPDGKTLDYGVWGSAGLNEIAPLWMLKYLPNMPACHTTILYDIQGPSNTQIPGDTSGLVALAEAARIIRRDAADVMVVGSSEGRINPITLSRYNLFLQLSKRNDDPAHAVRPFDLTRDGTVYGEGAAVFALEELEHARGRKANIVGELVGWAAGVDRGKKGPGLARVIRNALAAAGIEPKDVDHVNAHGTGTTVGDAFEARGIADVFGRDVPVFAPLSRFGNLGAASGLMELACSVQAFKNGLLPGTLNHESPDPACPISVHVGAPRPVTKPYVVKVTYTDLGQCAAAVVKRWDS
ncbi:3-oxoacyl-[acyl-carrier-protein] synthase 2 [Gemmata obscuriglobus]|nr:beta-ketoacyl-[acyl-carrier-protein] synthase family protein [Gemmata obscuriglobus]QEG32397.1 3-oxoacyl-[acyl-carrier-protein] synthase 2 [Gemmata obscuriglobus]VTS11753.1 3-oxoacyl-acp synthase : 3-oxoacyl-(Acyl-carrier-protein) synthase OS=Singulisphaera acidiphila (strain ATCC BAA-1392 / DSM 18658 / VKM B-2454 / MOB10) GN=Sinac_6212 PE=3 SV=1: ketoacyl-synt: Ketoacyl-synt_C [Gemmata obscuriglobus UQM 2246]